MISATTQRLLAFLSDAASYPHHPAQVTWVQTHASWVFIASPLVCKIKKPVNFGFLDFSTLDLRRADCESEVALNRRLAEDIYLGIEPIVESDGALHFGGEGEVIEWTVMMREMDPRLFLKQLMKEHTVGFIEMDRIVDKLHRFYIAQPPLPDKEVQPANTRLQQWTEDNFASAQTFAGQSISQAALDAIMLYTREFFSQHSALLASRIKEGWIRDCHGDLHLEHIHLMPDALHIYDCIEFNTEFRHIDIANDIAFLAMDLDFNERPDLARYIVDRFATVLHDAGMKPLMDFYKCYRACVRGKVESLHAKAETATESERKESLQLARRYFRHALHYAIAGSAPRVFVFMGKVASGKSALAEVLGHETGWAVHSSDRTRKTLAGTPMNHRGSEVERGLLYSAEMTRRTYDELFALAFASLRRGHCVILDATFSTLAHRKSLKASLEIEGCEATWIEAYASEPVIRQRLMERDHDSSVISDARFEDYQKLSADYEPPLELSPGELIRISTDGPVDDVCRALLMDMVKRGV